MIKLHTMSKPRAYTYTAILLLLLANLTVFAQESGDQLYDNSYIHDIRLSFEEDNFWQILEGNFDSGDVGNNNQYLMATVTIDGEQVDSIGVRFKGFTSYNPTQNKRPFKLDINEFVPGKRYDGLRKINLNNATADPAMQRDVICYDMLRSMGVKAARTAYSHVYLNDEYWGLYQVIEQVDKEFLDRNFGDSDGLLYKNLGWHKFEWEGPNPQPYQNAFVLKTKEETQDWDSFIHLMDVLNNTTDEEFDQQIEDIFDVDLFLKTLAVDVSMDNWDSYLEHGRNWYMYQDSINKKFRWIPWDYNLALGGTLSFGGFDECAVFISFQQITRESLEVEFVNTSFVSGASIYDWDFGDGSTSTDINPTHIYAGTGSYNVCLTATDTTRENCTETDCRWIDLSFDPSLCSSLSNGGFDGEYNDAFSLTVDFEPSCCEVWGEFCEDIYSWMYDITNPSSGTGGGFGGFTIDQSDNEGVLISRLLANERFSKRYYDYHCELLEDHLVSDRYDAFVTSNYTLIENAVRNDPNYLFTIEEFEEDSGMDGLLGYLDNRVEALQQELDESGHTCPTSSFSTEWHDVVINEVVASNDSTSGIVDPSGEADDWIELYNNTDEAISLSNMYLSDSKTDLKKWKFPVGTIIEPFQYLIVWADRDEEQDGVHTSFKLNKAGDELRLSNDEGTIVDSMSYTELETNVAYARVPNGTGDFTRQEATFAFSNESVSTTEAVAIPLAIYPNPATNYIEISTNGSEGLAKRLTVYDMHGRLILDGEYSTDDHLRLPTETLLAGMYTVVMTTAESVWAGKFIKQ